MMKLECIKKMKQLQLSFANRIEPAWHNKKLDEVNAKMQIYTRYEERRR